MTSTDPQNPYADAHKDPQGVDDARPTAIQVIKDLDLVNNIAGKIILVTGSSSGIGIETVRALHLTGADVYMQVRNLEKGEKVRTEILSSSEGHGKLEIVKMDLDSFASIREGANDFLSQTNKLNILINNAGVRNTPEGRTIDGYETQFAVNHLSHFLLFQLLLPTLLKSSTPAFHSRVINVSSGAHRSAQINFANPNAEGEYNPRTAYAQSKTANILMANHLDRLHGSQGLHGLSVHPGAILTGLQRESAAEIKARVASDEMLRRALKSPAQGAATQVWAAVAPVWEGRGGVYLEDCRVARESEEPSLLWGGYRSYIYDEEAEKKLWEMSEEMVGVKAKGVE